MEYCPYCAEPLSKPSKICPHCRKSLDTDLLKQIYEPGKTSKLNKKLLMKKWYREKVYIIFPIITLIVGFIIGALLFYGFAQVQFVNERAEFQGRISELQKTIEEMDISSGNVKQDLENKIIDKDEIISILTEQNAILNRVIVFTRRLATNSTITPNTQEEADYYRRNCLYLINLFNEQQEKLTQTEYTVNQDFNLRSLPQFLE